MRGLRLFVRPIETHDSDAVRDFLSRHAPGALHRTPDAPAGPGSPAPACGLLGKLLGDIVAVVIADVAGDALRIDAIVVAPELRKKRVGRAMVREAAELASKLDLRRLVVRRPCEAEDFLRRVGFEIRGDEWILGAGK